MSQHDLDIANQGFPATRADINDALQALGSTNSGATAPSTTYANQLWYDTANNIIKIRNEDNDAWISLFTLDQTNDNIEALTVNGTVTVDQLNSDNIRIDGNTISSTDTNGDITLDLDGTGGVTQGSGTFTIKNADSDGNGLKILQDTSDTSKIINHYNGPMIFGTNNTERMRIDSSGHILIGQTSSSAPGAGNTTHGTCLQDGGRLFLSADGVYSLSLNRSDSGELTNFHRAGAFKGSINITTSAVSYNTSSDARLKENIADMTGAIDRVKQLAPKRFNFIEDADNTVDGFLAHEAQAVVPEAVTGTHNEVETWTQQEIDDGNAPDGTSAGDNKLDADGNTIPIMQGIDQSKLVPLLTGALCEAITKIETLETQVADLTTRVAALEA